MIPCYRHVVHVDRSDNKEILRNVQADSFYQLLAGRRNGISSRVKVADVPIEIAWVDDWICYELLIFFTGGFARAQKFGKIVFDRREVHFVKTDEERRVGECVRLQDEAHEVR